MHKPELYTKRFMKVYREGSLHDTCDPIVIETQMAIVVNCTELAILACSPENFGELALGYLLSEGILTRQTNLKRMELRPSNQVWIEADIVPNPASGRVINTCMAHGHSSPDFLDQGIYNPVPDNISFYAEDLLHLITELNDKSDTFRLTGGVHSAGLGQGSSLVVRYEDIGRHNAVDKVFGYSYLNHISMDDKCLVLSGRIAGEILMKAARNGVSLILSRSAPTLRTVELAEKLGLTIVGFARGKRFNVYTHWERIVI